MNPTISKFFHFSYMEYFWVCSPNLSSQLVISVSNPIVSIITTNVSNIVLQSYCHTMLLASHILCLWAMVSIRRLLQLFLINPPPPPPPLFVVLQEIFYEPNLALLRLLQKIMHFQSKTNFLIQLIAGQFWFCCFVYMFFLGRFFTALLSWNYE